MHYGSFLRTLCILLDTYWIYLDVFLLLLGALWLIHVMLVCVESFVDDFRRELTALDHSAQRLSPQVKHQCGHPERSEGSRS